MMRRVLVVGMVLLLLGCSAQDASELDERNGMIYVKGSKMPYTGKVVRYYPDTGKERRIYQHGYYEMGVKDGTWTTYRWNGEREETPYKFGKLNGTLRQFSNTGVLLKEENYRNNVLHGMAAEWTITGELIVQKNYQDGKMIPIPVPEGSTGEDRTEDEYWKKVKSGFEKGHF